MQIIAGSNTILRSFVLTIVINTISKIAEAPELLYIPFRNVELDFEHLNDRKDMLIVFKNFKQSVETLNLKNVTFKSYHEFADFIIDLPNLTSLTFENCDIKYLQNEAFPTVSNLQYISLINCNENVFKICQLQTNLVKIRIQSDLIELPSEIFNNISKKFANLEHLVLIGQGTRSFFDCQFNYQFKLKKLETTMLSYHWYVGIKTERTSFLKSQLGHLKDLTIHELPNDFDGGRVLKFIINQMNLETFYYGKIPLILNGQKQEVRELEATETQICSAFEMVEQFPSKWYELDGQD